MSKWVSLNLSSDISPRNILRRKRIYRKTRCDCIHDHLLGTSWIHEEVVRREANGEEDYRVDHA